MKIRLPLLVVIALALAGGIALSFGYKRMPHQSIVRTITFNRSKKIKVAAYFCASFDTTHVLVNPADCNTSNGSVVGLQGTGTGTLVYSWYNAIGAKISDQSDLMNVPTGSYRVTLTDESKCGVVSLTYFVKENNPVSIDYTSGTIISPTCNVVDGSITNIVVKNATKFQWLDGTYAVIPGATTKDLLNVGPGTYILNATNDRGCLAQARYVINPGPYAPIMTAFTVKGSDCGATGEFNATFDLKAGDPSYNYIINDQNNKDVAAGIISYIPTDSIRIHIDQLAAGKYTLLAVGGTCVTKLTSFVIAQDTFRLDLSGILIHTDVCGQKKGVIIGIKVLGGPSPPSPRRIGNTGFFWSDSNGTDISSLSGIAGVTAGTYTLRAVNPEGCVATATFIIPDSIAATSKPILNDVKMCLPGIAALDVLNKDPGSYYRLYDSTQQTILDTSTAGYFARKVNVTTTFYLQSVNGICASPLGKVTATVVNPGVSIPNAFTPNNDGINDYWDITGLGNYPGTEVSVFNRNGQRVYHTINYSSPFNGQYNSKDLPVGAYYFIVDTKKPDCRGGISGSLTIIR